MKNALEMEAAGFSETRVTSFENVVCRSPEDYHLSFHPRENVVSR